MQRLQIKRNGSQWLLIFWIGLWIGSCASMKPPLQLGEEQRIRTAIAIYPEHWLGYLRLAEYYRTQKKWKTRLEVLEKGYDQFPTAIPIINALGKFYQILGRNDQALAIYEQSIARLPQSEALYLFRGKLWWDLNEPAKAKHDWEKVLSLAKDQAEAFSLLGMYHLSTQEEEKALFYFLQAVEQIPHSASLWYKIGLLQQKTSQHQKALQSYQKAVQLESKNYEYLQRYLTLLEFSAPSEANLKERQKLLTWMLQLTPQDYWSNAHYGHYLLTQKKYAEAEKYFLKSLSLKPDYSWAYFQLGILYTQQKDWQKVEKYLSKGVALEPNQYWSKKQIAYAYEQQHQILSAIEAYLSLLDHAELEEDVLMRLAKLYWYHGEVNQVERILVTGTKRFPKSTPIHLLLGEYYEAHHRLAEAKQTYLTLLQRIPTQIHTLGKLGRIEVALGNRDQAKKYFESVLMISPTLQWAENQFIQLELRDHPQNAKLRLEKWVQTQPSEWAFYQLGRVEIQQGNLTKSIAIFSEGISLKPNSLVLREALIFAHLQQANWQAANEQYQQLLQFTASPRRDLLLYQALVHHKLGQAKQAQERLAQARQQGHLGVWSWVFHLFITPQEVRALGWSGLSKQESQMLERLLLAQETDSQELDEHLLQKIQKPSLRAFLKSLFWMKNNQVENALQELDSLSEKDRPLWMQFYQAMLQEKRQQYSQALHNYTRVLEAVPDYSWANAKIGLIYHQQSKLQQSIHYFTLYLQNNPNAVWAIYRVAMTHTLLGTHPQAIEGYERVLALHSQHSSSMNNLAWLYLTTPHESLRNPAKALQFAQKAVSIEPSEENLDTLAEAYFQSRQPERAMETIKKALDQTWTSPKKLVYLAKQYKRFIKKEYSSLPDEM